MNRATLFFDIDNTLLDRDAAFRRFITELVHRFLPSLSASDNGRTVEHIIELDSRGVKERELFCRELLLHYPEIDCTVDEIWQMHRSLPEFVLPDKRLTALLNELSREYTLAVISNGSSDMQRRKLQRLEIEDLFDHIYISGEQSSAKPDPSIFETAQKSGGNGISVMIGDDEINDIIPASKLRFKTVLVSEHTGIATAADAVISEIYDLKEVLQWLI